MADPQVEQLRSVLEMATPYPPNEIDLAFRHMFGGIGVYAHGQMFASLSNVGLALKLPQDAQSELSVLGGRGLQYAPDAPVSKQYMVLPDAVVHNSEALARWVRASIDYVQTLPKKKKK
jgi:TfoX/Sxy family transcriptional regulator of competence genes